ncbi:MAG: aldolase/citrate lyase family protein [Nitrososphaerales archaeon]
MERLRCGVKNLLKEKLKQGKAAFGTFLTIGHPDVAEIIGSVGFDFVVFDMEHAPLDFGIVQSMMQAMSYSETTPLIRVAWNDLVLFKQALDIGAHGLVIPWVNSGDEAEYAVKAAKYPPRGIRGFGPRRAALRDRDYTATADSETMLIVQIETKTALNNLDSIFSVDGVDACFIGPMDFTMSLGILGQLEHPSFEEALVKVVESSKKHNVIPGIATVPIEGRGYMPDLAKVLGMGFKMISLGYDLGFLRKSAAELLSSAISLASGQAP